MAREENIFTASHRFARISASKARLVMDVIRGDAVEAALVKLRFSQRRASPMIRKVLRSALANATQKAGLTEDQLVVWRAFVDGGPILKRIKPRAQGRAYPRFRRTCHLSIVLKQVEKQAQKPKGQKTSPRGSQEKGSQEKKVEASGKGGSES